MGRKGQNATGKNKRRRKMRKIGEAQDKVTGGKKKMYVGETG